MFLAGANFALHYRVLRKRFNPLRDEEFRAYIAILLVASLILFLELLRADIYAAGETAVRQSVFQVVSMMTTTGYGSANFVDWTVLTSLTLVAVMLIGGCAGSTAGAIKVGRHLTVAKLLRREIDQSVHREAVVPDPAERASRRRAHAASDSRLRPSSTSGSSWPGPSSSRSSLPAPGSTSPPSTRSALPRRRSATSGRGSASRGRSDRSTRSVRSPSRS